MKFYKSREGEIMNLKKLEERLNQKFKGKEYLDKFKVIPDIMEIIAEKKNITTLKLKRLPSRDNIRTMIIETDVGNVIIKNKATKKSAFQFVIGAIEILKSGQVEIVK